MPRSTRITVLVAAAALIPGLAACSSGTVAMEPAEESNDPACAEIISRLPESISGQERRHTDAQATGAWGDPATVLMTCGLEPPAPTTLPCRSFDGVDWIVDESQAADDLYTLTTYGREPAIQVFLNQGITSSGDVAQALSPLIQRYLPATGAACVAASEATPAPDTDPTPDTAPTP